MGVFRTKGQERKTISSRCWLIIELKRGKKQPGLHSSCYMKVAASMVFKKIFKFGFFWLFFLMTRQFSTLTQHISNYFQLCVWIIFTCGLSFAWQSFTQLWWWYGTLYNQIMIPGSVPGANQPFPLQKQFLFLMQASNIDILLCHIFKGTMLSSHS